MLPGLVDCLAGQAKVRNRRGGRRMFPAGTFAPTGRNLAPLLCRVVLIREPALGLCLYLEGIGLGPVCSRDQLVMRAKNEAQSKAGVVKE
ncbi:hypothetical protein CIW48_26185 [Methylobacterium sp. P1-11]|uniref:hypothetical protein n=1 Tax=Methylobacterium sp. P1-11 TaxID=2024616 RepID=UPI0011F07AC2|nr:hypothetical protein [Methylobacterium sp. P1-11]KAA0120998.1 hypothetical protein CIW48_26185 [Methylobacterium sp. P1-11]